MTKREVLEETYDWYVTQGNPRGIDADGNCCYFDPVTGSMCSVGRCLETSGGIANISIAFSGAALEYLKPQYKNLHADRTFWADLQSWHDNRSNWYGIVNRLTFDGQKNYEFLLRKYG